MKLILQYNIPNCKMQQNFFVRLLGGAIAPIAPPWIRPWNSGRIARNNYLNDIIYYALVKAGVLSTKKPAGLSRTDCKRPDGLTLVPWLAGKNAVWDVTVSGAKKELKYSELSTNYLFIPLAFESLGSVGSKTLIFLLDFGRRLTGASDDSRETAFLFQRLSICNSALQCCVLPRLF